jgi:hypothetical protein
LEQAQIPQNLSEINIPEGIQDKIFYMPLEDSFIIWFGMSLGESLVYESKTKCWSPSP